jgi:hypothetical protein
VVLEVESFSSQLDATPELNEVRNILKKAKFRNIIVDELQKGSRVYQVYAKRDKTVCSESLRNQDCEEVCEAKF